MEIRGKKRKVNSWLGIFNQRKLILPHPLPNFEIQKYYQNEPRLNGLYSRYNLPKRIIDGVYLINLDEYADVGTCWICFNVTNIEIIHFHSLGVEHVPKEIKNLLDIKT